MGKMSPENVQKKYVPLHINEGQVGLRCKVGERVDGGQQNDACWGSLPWFWCHWPTGSKIVIVPDCISATRTTCPLLLMLLESWCPWWVWLWWSCWLWWGSAPGCEWPISSRVAQRGMASLQPWNKVTSSVSGGEAIICLMIEERIRTVPLWKQGHLAWWDKNTFSCWFREIQAICVEGKNHVTGTISIGDIGVHCHIVK